ncbi:MAG: DUF748 domain-containing protein [Candidatus Omnitrophica bacterium]|nr:DUF748 domain-containing protein [Candidatus Omnitrophota bacterium]
MRYLIKSVVIYFLVLFLIVTAIYTSLALRGKDLIIRKLEDLTRKKVSIDYFFLSPTFHLQLKKINIEGLFKADSINLAPSILRLFSGKIAFNSIKMQKPEFILERFAPEATVNLTEAASGKKVAKPKQILTLPFICKRLKIWEGRIDYIDHTLGQDGFKIIVNKINFYLNNFNMFSHSLASDFQITGELPWQEGQEVGKIKAEGWINFFKKNMEANLNISDIDGIHFYPYYSNWVDLEKARIEKAKLNFTSDISSLNNNLTANCHLELTDIVFTPRSPEEAEEKAEKIATAVLDIFKSLDEGKIVLGFVIRTKMDSPEFRLGDVRMAVEDKLTGSRKYGLGIEDVFMLPTKVLEGMFKGATGMSKAFIGGTFAIGKEIKDSVQGAFKKEGNVATQEQKE